MVFPDRFRSFKITTSLIVSILVMYYVIILYFKGSFAYELSYIQSVLGALFNEALVENFFRMDPLSRLIILFIGLFTLLIMIYSSVFIRKEDQYLNYFPLLLMTLGASNGAVLSDHLLVFLIFWSILAILLFKLIPSNTKESANAAIKSLIIIGASDVILLFGIAIIWSETGSLAMSELTVNTNNWQTVIAFLALLIGAFTKAGGVPFHSWIPDFTKNAPSSSSAYLPASLDKLLGIYFMVRICHEVFILNQWLILLILIIGVATIIIGVMMAMVQHDYHTLLGYHAISQVGYMIVGIGLGTALGLIGGLFHMINNALYKSGLFLAAGAVKQKTGQHQIDRLGGLSRNMPVTFVSALIFSLAISGIPPLNGFASKWIIYQAIIDFGSGSGIANHLWILWLGLAVIGSALTLASFIKFISGTFLERIKQQNRHIKESNPFMQFSLMVLAIFCVGFGVFATHYVVPFLFGDIVGPVGFPGNWSSGMVSILILVSLAIGFLIYALGNMKNFRKSDSFLGGERLHDSTEFPSTNFYHTISQSQPFSFMYSKASHGWFDLYELSRLGVLKLTQWLRITHTGILQTYAIWMIVGLIILLILLLIL